MNTQLNNYLESYQQKVIQIARVTMLVGCCIYLSLILAPRGLENITPLILSIQLIALTYIGVSFLFSKNARLQALLGATTLFAIATLALVNFGPIMTAGVVYVTAVIWCVFFYNNLSIALVTSLICMASVAVFQQAGMPMSWNTEIFGPVVWLSTICGALAPIAACGYIVKLMLSSMINSLLLEQEARTRELTILREKDLIEKAMSQRDRLESVGQLATGVAHDFNNILTVLMGSVEVLKVVNDDTTRKAIIEDMESAIRSAEATAKQLLTCSTESTDQPADPRSSLRSLSSNLKRLFPENIVIETRLQGTPRVCMPTGQFEQSILNLCINARDALIEGGTISIDCYKDPISGEVVVEVIDNGAGMERDVLKQAVDPFFTTKANLKGTGLGLSQVHAAVNRVNGRLHIHSNPGDGTRVQLVLPVAELPVEDLADAEPDIEPAKDYELLLLDDDTMVAKLISISLEAAGYKVTTATGVQQALGILDKKSFGVLISDRGLPDGDPATVVNKFRSDSNGPVLLISGYAVTEPLEENISFLQKPFTPSTLVQRLDQMLTCAA